MTTAIDIQRTENMPAQAAAPMTPMEMVGRALEMGVSADILKQMMDLRDREDAKQARKAFDAAISKAKSRMSPVVKNATGHNSKRYADFSAIARMVDPILSEYGLSYRFKTTQIDKITVTCVLSHEDGHSEETTLSAPSDTTGNKNAIQAIGSTITYLSRYSLMASLGLSASEDDDGRAAGRSDDQNRTITPEQVKTVLQLIEETESDIAQFCQMGKIDSVADMLASQFDSAVRLLNQKKAKLGQRVAS
ncbi:hypothetical protein GAO09_19550 [Rhizobiales bacterium RZME27]|uniref:ERF family protein n=1 Tax=Endobacterium cereale TaxID=2663029 RepID=A0A6A8AAB7_9HYPH|nr:ERF family protein [Endobacterium cereale]MQY48233.1 hypothetical protein [Endobacterium cereale]